MDAARNNLSLDIYDLCLILQSVGFRIKDKNCVDDNKSVGRSISITCHISGSNIVLESSNPNCYCSYTKPVHDTEKWEMSGTSGGVQVSKMENSTRLTQELPKTIISNIQSKMAFLVDIVRSKPYKLNCSLNCGISENILAVPESKELHTSDFDEYKLKSDIPLNHLSRSSSDLNSPSREIKEIKANMSNRYRSLETLANHQNEPMLPTPLPLHAVDKVKVMRQNTYTSTFSKVTHVPLPVTPARTSSPVPFRPKIILNKLHSAETLANELTLLLKETKKIIEEDKNIVTSPYSVMDVSKISCSQGQTIDKKHQSRLNVSTKSTLPYASSPNLSRIQEPKLQYNNNLKRIKSASTCKINTLSNPVKLVQKSSSLKRTIPKRLTSLATLSPNFGYIGSKKNQDLTSILGTQTTGIYKPLGDKSTNSVGSINVNETQKKKSSLYSHIKPKVGMYSSIKK